MEGMCRTQARGTSTTLCPSLSIEQERKHRIANPSWFWKTRETLRLHFLPQVCCDNCQLLYSLCSWTPAPSVTLLATSISFASSIPQGKQIPALMEKNSIFFLSFFSKSLPISFSSCVSRHIGRLLPNAELRNLFFFFYPTLLRVWKWEWFHHHIPKQGWNHEGAKQLNHHQLWWVLSHLPEGLLLSGAQPQASVPEGSRTPLLPEQGHICWLCHSSQSGFQGQSLPGCDHSQCLLRRHSGEWWGIDSHSSKSWWILCLLRTWWLHLSQAPTWMPNWGWTGHRFFLGSGGVIPAQPSYMATWDVTRRSLPPPLRDI